LQRRRAAREAALEAARADLTNAEWNLERISELRQSGTAAVEELKNARDEFRAAAATVDQLAAELRVIDEQLEDTRLRAPLAGRVTEQLVDVGDFVDVGDRITTVYQVDPLELAFWLPARAAPSVAPGQAVEVTAPARPDRTFDGELVFVSPAVNPQTRQFLVKARLSNPDGALKPGVFARGTVITATRELPVVPEECLVNLRNRHVVFEVTEGTAQLREVDIALRQPGRVALRGNIAPGDQVVRTGHMRLTDGAAVRVEPSAGTTRPSTQRSSPRAADAEAPP
jgi:membrane fusion protein (multidrug efflux system)